MKGIQLFMYYFWIQIYVDEIIFGSTNEKLCKEFELCIKNEFEMSMMRELNYFLGLQIKEKSDKIFINQAKYTRELIKRFCKAKQNSYDHYYKAW